MFDSLWHHFREYFSWRRGGEDPPPGPRDPFAEKLKPLPLRPRPKGLTGSVALAEPDDDGN